MFERFTEKSIKVVMIAQEEARRLNLNFVGTEQMLLGLVGENTGTAAIILIQEGLDFEELRDEIDRILGVGKGYIPVDLPFTPRAKASLEDSLRLASEFGHSYVATEHLLLAVLEQDFGLAKQLFSLFDVKAEVVRSEVLVFLGYETNKVPYNYNQTGDLNYSVNGNMGNMSNQMEFGDYTTDLTKQASDGLLDPVVGRADEIKRVTQILVRRKKNNPVLVGEPGVGKTAVAEGLASRIVEQDVPDLLLNRSLVSLDLGLLLAGTKYRGEFEERIKRVMEEVQKKKELILVIDEIHMVIGAGAGEGAVDAANILKPALARGEFQCIGATTLEEYRKNIERDAALERRFQPVTVPEPSIENTIEILKGLRPRYEAHHQLIITNEALEAAANLGAQYIADRFLPDKAIDLVDEACAMVRLNNSAASPPVQELLKESQKILVLRKEAERRGDYQEAGELFKTERLIQDHRRIVELQEKERIEREAQEREKEKKEALKEEKRSSKLKDLTKFSYTYNKNYKSPLKFYFESLGYNPPESTSFFASNSVESLNSNFDSTLPLTQVPTVELSIDYNHIATIVSEWSGIPVTKVSSEETGKLKELEEVLRQRVIGQRNAIHAVSSAVRRARVGLKNPNRPIASFIFAGPTGVGKTELTKALAQQFFGSQKSMVRLDMSEYMERHHVAKLIGSPPGYVGYSEGGYLTEAVRRKPYTVVLFDEVEKAHPDVFNLLLQLLDDGRLTDSQGKVVSFKNTLIILTSNLGSQSIIDNASQLASLDEQETLLKKENDNKLDDNDLPSLNDNSSETLNSSVTNLVSNELKKFFRPEFLNRIDETIVFQPLSREDIQAITKLMVNEIIDRVREQGLALNVTDATLAKFARDGYNPVYGARPLRRTIMSSLEDLLATEMLDREFSPGQVKHVTADVNSRDKVFLKWEEQKISKSKLMATT